MFPKTLLLPSSNGFSSIYDRKEEESRRADTFEFENGLTDWRRLLLKRTQEMLPDELWDKILESVDDNSVMTFASVCKQLRRVQRRSGRKLKTDMKSCSSSSFGGNPHDVSKYKELSTVSEEWCHWTMSFLSAAKKQSIQIMNAAAFSGHLGALKYWKERTRTKESLFDEQTCAFAAYGGHLEVLVWLRENNCPWNEATCRCAAWGGHLDVLKYAHEKGCPWDARTCMVVAARGGHLEVLKNLHEKGCYWDASTCSEAAEGGHLEVLKYAHEKGSPWDEWTCSEAAKGGHLEVLKYARLHGCPFDKRTCMTAARKGQEDMKRKHNVGHQEVIEYLEKLN